MGLRLDLLDLLAVGADDRLADGRVPEGAAVGDGRVDGGHLDGGDEGVALADGVVDGVTGAHEVAFEAVLVGEQLDVGAALLAGLAPLVLVGLPEPLLPRAVGDAALLLAGEVDVGLGAEAELVGGLVEDLRRVLDRVESAVLEPLLVAEGVEDGVAGDFECLAEGDAAVALGLEVLEDLSADGVGAGAGVAAVERVSGVDGRGGGDDLEDGAGGGLALDGPVHQGDVGLLGGELGVVLAGDPADPDVGVVGGVGGHGDDAAGLGFEDDDGPGVGLVGDAGVAVDLLAGLDHGGVELVLGDALDAGVDAGDEVGAGDRGVVLGLSDDAAEVVDLVAGDAGLAAQLPVVGAFQTEAADLVGAQERRVGLLGLDDLVVGDRGEVAEDLAGVGSAGGRVAAYGGGLGGDAGEVLGAFADLEGLLGGGLQGDRDRLVGGAVPAGLGGLGVAEPDLVHDVLRLHVQHPGEPGQDAFALVLYLHQLGAAGGDDEAGLVVGERDAAGVEDGAAHGGLDHLLDVVVLGLVRVLGAVADLEVPQPPAEGEQQREDEHLEDDEPDLHPGGAAGLRNVGHYCSPVTAS